MGVSRGTIQNLTNMEEYNFQLLTSFKNTSVKNAFTASFCCKMEEGNIGSEHKGGDVS